MRVWGGGGGGYLKHVTLKLTTPKNHARSLHLTALHATNPGAATSELWQRCLLLPTEVERLLYAFVHLLFLLARQQAQDGACVSLWPFSGAVCPYGLPNAHTHTSTNPPPPTASAAPPLAATTAAELFHFCRVHPQLVLVAYHGG